VRGVTLGDTCTRRLRVCPDPVSPLLELGGTQSAEPEVGLVLETGGHLLPAPPHPGGTTERAHLRDVLPHPSRPEQLLVLLRDAVPREVPPHPGSHLTMLEFRPMRSDVLVEGAVLLAEARDHCGAGDPCVQLLPAGGSLELELDRAQGAGDRVGPAPGLEEHLAGL